VDTRFLENTTVQQGHDPAATPAIIALPGRALKATSGHRSISESIFDRLQLGADSVAQSREPTGGRLLLRLDIGREVSWNILAIQQFGSLQPFLRKDSQSLRTIPNLMVVLVKEFFLASTD
jgi:hypothetical protein